MRLMSVARWMSDFSSERHSSGAMTRGIGSNCHGCSTPGSLAFWHARYGSDALFMEEAAAGLAAAFEFRRPQLLDLLDKARVMRQQLATRGKGFVEQLASSRVAREQVGGAAAALARRLFGLMSSPFCNPSFVLCQWDKFSGCASTGRILDSCPTLDNVEACRQDRL